MAVLIIIYFYHHGFSWFPLIYFLIPCGIISVLFGFSFKSLKPFNFENGGKK